jgi:periplasmic protein CpxP/Spy
MKHQLLSLLTGAITLSFTAIPSLAQVPLVQSQPEQIQKQRKFAGVELTEIQRTQLNEIHRNARSQLEEVLTSEQRRQLESSRESGNQGRTAFTDMNLSLEQKEQIQSIMRSTKTRTDAILTPEQRQQVQRNMEQRRQERQN